MVITPEIKSGDLEFDSQPRPRIFHLLQWVSISVPEDLYIYIYIYIYCMCENYQICQEIIYTDILMCTL